MHHTPLEIKGESTAGTRSQINRGPTVTLLIVDVDQPGFHPSLVPSTFQHTALCEYDHAVKKVNNPDQSEGQAMHGPWSLWWIVLVLPGQAAGVEPANGLKADNALSADESKNGWILLFDGTSLGGWQTSSGKPSKVPVEDGCINPHGSGGYMVIHEKTWDNFVLSLDFKISKGCNSGVFIRTYPLTPRPGKDVGFNGIEVAIDDTTTSGYHDTGAIYDLVKPSKNTMKPVGLWNRMVITCDGPKLAIELNGELVTTMDLDQWTAPNRRPDGSEHKFDVAYKDHPRSGYIGLQDHGSACWYKNIKIKRLGR